MTRYSVFVKTLHKDRLFLIKFRLIGQIAMNLVYIQPECFLRDSKLSRKEKSRDIIAAFATCDFCDFFFRQQFAFWLIFQPRLKYNYSPFWHFPYSILFTAWAFFEFVAFKAPHCIKFLQYFDFWIFTTFNSRELSFKNRRKNLITFLKFSSRDIFFNVLKTNFTIGVNHKWLEDLEMFLYFIAKDRAFSKDRTLQDFKKV